MVLNFDSQLNNPNETKTLNEVVEDVFTVKKSVVDLAFFYEEKKDISIVETRDDKNIKLPNVVD